MEALKISVIDHVNNVASGPFKTKDELGVTYLLHCENPILAVTVEIESYGIKRLSAGTMKISMEFFYDGVDCHPVV